MFGVKCCIKDRHAMKEVKTTVQIHCRNGFMSMIISCCSFLSSHHRVTIIHLLVYGWRWLVTRIKLMCISDISSV